MNWNEENISSFSLDILIKNVILSLINKKYEQKRFIKMKKFKFIAFIAIATMALASCDNKINPVHDTVPVDTTFWSGNGEEAFYFPLDEFHQLGEKNDTAGQRTMVDKYRKVLTANVVAHYPQISNEKSIRFVLGSGYAEDVKSGDGKVYSGKFKNELIIILNDPSVKDTIFLACSNGMLRPLRLYTQSDFGTAEQWRFTIKKGEGLANYLPQLERWGSVANQLNIPIKDKDGKVVSQETYLNYLGKYQSLLFEGDVIDLLADKVYNKAGQEVQFDRRKAETRKANAKTRKEARAQAKRQRRR